MRVLAVEGGCKPLAGRLTQVRHPLEIGSGERSPDGLSRSVSACLNPNDCMLMLAQLAVLLICSFIQPALELSDLCPIFRLDLLQVVDRVSPRLLVGLQRFDSLQANASDKPYPVVNGVAG